ncbi:MAG: MFS transporter [Deltaproteobacteria bacterium]|nr:MFS transporter [Deltaproteobacteria bacterium]
MLKRFNGLFYGWRMVAASAALRVLGAGLHSFGFTIFFLPLSQDLNLSRTATSFAFSLARAEGAIEGPIVGHVLDRYGPRPVMLTAVLLMGVGYLLLSTVESYAMFLVVYIGVISLAHSGGFMHAPMVLTNSWFIRKRARAITVNSASFSLGGVLIAPVLSAIVLSWGWRWGAAFAGVMFLLIGVPLSLTIRRSPESMGLLPDGDIPSASAEDQKNEPQRRAPAEVDVTTGEAFRSFTFWTLVLGNAIRNMSYHAIATHFVPLMVWKGMSQPQAAFLLSSFAFLGMTTTLLLGWFADRVNKPRLVAGILFVAAGGMLLPVFGSSMWLLLLFTLLFTAVESTYAIGWAVVGDFFGRKHFAKIRGYMSFFYMWGGVAGPVIAGAIYDRWQTYEPMLWALVLLFALSGAIFGMLIKRWEKLRAQMTPRIDNDV